MCACNNERFKKCEFVCGRCAIDPFLLQIADPSIVSVEDRDKLQSVEILVADPTLLSPFNFQFTNLKWLQSLTAGKKFLCNFVVSYTPL